MRIQIGGNKKMPTVSKFEGYRKFISGDYEYVISYFQAVMKEGQANPYNVADQFTAYIEKWANEGWEFYRTDAVPYQIQPGCLSSLLGGKVSFGQVTMVSFRKKIIK
jgi:hypothetical protein